MMSKQDAYDNCTLAQLVAAYFGLYRVPAMNKPTGNESNVDEDGHPPFVCKCKAVVTVESDTEWCDDCKACSDCCTHEGRQLS